MKKLTIILALCLFGFNSFSQTDTTFTFVNDTIEGYFKADSTVQSDFIVIDTVDLGFETEKDYELKPWYFRSRQEINQFRYIDTYVQKAFRRHETKVVRLYRYNKTLYIWQPQKIIKKIVNN